MFDPKTGSIQRMMPIDQHSDCNQNRLTQPVVFAVNVCCLEGEVDRPVCAHCHERPAVCEGIPSAGIEWGPTPLCEECGGSWHADLQPLFPHLRVCDICHQRPSVNFITSLAEQKHPAWRNPTIKELLSYWAKRRYFCEECGLTAATCPECA